VVHGELRGRHRLVAVLAGTLVAKQQVPSVGPQHPAWNLDVRQQSNNHHVVPKTAPSDSLLDRLPRDVIDEGDALLGEQNDKPPLADDVKRLK